MVAAGYVLYSSATVMVVTTDAHKGIYSFTLDPNFGEFIMTQVGVDMFCELIFFKNKNKQINKIIFLFLLLLTRTFVPHTQRNMKIPDKPKTIYSVNTGNAELWDSATKKFVEYCNTQAKPYSGRYIGSMVSDVHR